MGCYNRGCCWHCMARQDVQLKYAQHTGFCEYMAELRLAQTVRYAGPFCVKNAKTITVFIINTGPSPVTAYLEISPNGVNFMEDPQRLELLPGAMGALTPYLFSKYLRVAAISPHGRISVNVQIQNG